MDLFRVVAAALASCAFGALWYRILGKRWIMASGVRVDPVTGRAANASDPVPYITAMIAALLVASVMRYAFDSFGIDNMDEGLLAGVCIGLFVVTPWIATFYGFSNRPRALTLIDGGYATIGCGLMGLVLAMV